MRIADATLIRYHGSRENYLKSLNGTLVQEQSKQARLPAGPEKTKVDAGVTKIQQQLTDNEVIK